MTDALSTLDFFVLSGFTPSRKPTMAFLSSDFQFISGLVLDPRNGYLPTIRGTNNAPTTSPAAVASNDFVGSLATIEPIFFRESSGAATVEVVSGGAGDDAAGTGARKVRVVGLDSNYEVLEETINMNGTEPVTTTGTFRRVHELRVEQCGSGGTNEFDIVAKFTGAGGNCATIPADEGASSVNHYTVPQNHVGIIQDYLASFKQGSLTANPLSAQVQVMVRRWIWRDAGGAVLPAEDQFYGPWEVLRSMTIEPGVAPAPLQRPDALPHRSIVAVQGYLSAANGSSILSAGIGMVVQRVIYPVPVA